MSEPENKPSEGESLESTTEAPAAESSTEGESLEAAADNGTIDATGGGGLAGAPTAPQQPVKPPSRGGLKNKFRKVNIYFLGFLLALVIAGMALFIGLMRSREAANPEEISSQTLSTDAINELRGNDIKIGDPKQTLSVESNAVFAGRVLVQGGVDIAGALKVSGTISLNDVAVTGTGTFQQIQANALAVSGNAGVQGQLAVQGSANVTGGGSFGGALTAPKITADSLDLTGDLRFGRHLDAGGNTPSSSGGGALGAGGTSSNTGTDTAGTVVISTGSGPAAGCFVTINFAQAFAGTPHVVISPASTDAASLDYYVTRNTGSFSICATNPAGGRNYTFDYIVID